MSFKSLISQFCRWSTLYTRAHYSQHLAVVQQFLNFSPSLSQFRKRLKTSLIKLYYFNDAVVWCTLTVSYEAHSCFQTRLLPARRYASAGNSDRNVSVRPSVTRRYRVKTKKASGMISSPCDSPKTLIFWRQISSPNSKGFPPNGSFKQGSVGKIQRFF